MELKDRILNLVKDYVKNGPVFCRKNQGMPVQLIFIKLDYPSINDLKKAVLELNEEGKIYHAQEAMSAKIGKAMNAINVNMDNNEAKEAVAKVMDAELTEIDIFAHSWVYLLDSE